MLDLRIGYVLDVVEGQLFIGNDIGVCIVFLSLIKLKQGLAEAGLGLRFGLYLINSDKICSNLMKRWRRTNPQLPKDRALLPL